MHYIITFEDDSNFTSSSKLSQWNQISEKRIKKLEYFLTNKKKIVLEGFEQYNHVVKLGFGVNNKFAGIIAIYLMGKKADKVTRIILNFRTMKICKDVVEWEKEYNNKPHPGWKLGIASDSSQITLP